MSADLPDLRTAWNEACTQFQKATGFDLTSTTERKSADDIVAKFNSVKARDDKDSRKIEKVKTVVGKTVVAVERLGQIAADGASIVFGSPANIAMNCISVFINAGIEYKDIAHNIDDLFGRIITIMERFQIYRDNEQVMKPPMIRVAHRLLISIVEICRLCYKILKKNVLRKYLGIVLFSSDGGIKDQFALLDTLEKEELQMKGTLTLVASEKTQHDIQSMNAQNTKIASSMTELTESVSSQQILNDLREKLDVDGSLSKAEYQSYYDKIEPGSCTWLKTDSQYQSWADTKNDSNPLLILQGEEGCGKSYVLTAIIRDLRTRYPQDQVDANQISIAYCYLTWNGKKSAQSLKKDQNSKSGRSIRDALREWAWQIINKHVLYRKRIHATFKKNSDLGDLHEIWQKLFLDHLRHGTNFYLLLDGTHELDERGMDELRTLLQTIWPVKSSNGRLKIAITARPALLQKLTAKTTASAAIVNLRDKNRLDMEKYIRNKAGGLTIFQKASADVQELKEEVCTGLLDAVNGNFSLADIKLREISVKNDPEEVKQIVQNVSDNADLGTSVLEIIREYNRNLTSREIEILNTLLLWVIHAKWGLQVYELESLLFLQQGRTSLQPLVHEIKEKFSSFFEVVGDDSIATVTLKYDSIADYFQNMREHHTADTRGSDTLTKAEIRIVRHFVEKLCDQDIYQKLGLGDFFDHKLSQSDTVVAVDCENAHAKIALICLRINTEDLGDEVRSLQSYAAAHAVSHLTQIDLDRTDPKLKAELGLPLVKSFRDPEAIRKSNSWEKWSYLDEGVQNVIRMLRSSAVMSKVNTADTDDKDWIDAILKDQHPEIALLTDSAKVMAQGWLTPEEDSRDVMESFLWLYGYTNKIEKEENPDRPRFGRPRDPNKIDIDDFEKVLQKAQELQALDMSKIDILQKVAITHRECEHICEAIEQFKHIISLDPEYLPAYTGLSQCYAAEAIDGPKPDWHSALRYWDVVIERVRTGTQLDTDVEPKEQLQTLLVEKAIWLRKLERYDESREIYLGVLKDRPEDDEVRLQYILTLCEAQNHGAVVEALHDLDQVDESTQENRLTRFFHAQAHNHGYHSLVVQAFKQSSCMLLIRGYYQQALTDAQRSQTERVSRYVRCSLTYHLAAMLWNHGNDDTEKEEAIRLWESLLAQDNTAEQIYAARRLARIYIAKAVEAGRDSTLVAEILERVESFTRPRNGKKLDDEAVWGIGLSPEQARSLLARYYSKVGDSRTAKQLLQRDFDVGLKLLSDDDPENDWQGYIKLGNVFMDCGDDKNAIAAWTLIQPTQGLQEFRTNALAPMADNSSASVQENNELRTLHRQPTNSFSLAKKLDGPLMYICDGDCGKRWTFADDIFVCRECIDCQFDAPCLQKLRRGDLTRDICDKNHDFLHVPTWDIDSADRAEAGKVFVGDRVLDVSEWLEGIKREWSSMGLETGEC